MIQKKIKKNKKNNKKQMIKNLQIIILINKIEMSKMKNKNKGKLPKNNQMINSKIQSFKIITINHHNLIMSSLI